MSLGMKITTGLFAMTALLLSSAVHPLTCSAAEPEVAPEPSSSSPSQPERTPALLACLPDPLGINTGERDLGDVIEDAFEHSPIGRLKALVSGEEQADFAPPPIKLLPGPECFGGTDEEAAAPSTTQNN